MGRAGVEPALQPVDITVIYKTYNILTHEKTNRALRLFQLFSRYYRRIILHDEFLSATWANRRDRIRDPVSCTENSPNIRAYCILSKVRIQVNASASADLTTIPINILVNIRL